MLQVKCLGNHRQLFLTECRPNETLLIATEVGKHCSLSFPNLPWHYHGALWGYRHPWNDAAGNRVQCSLTRGMMGRSTVAVVAMHGVALPKL